MEADPVEILRSRALEGVAHGFLGRRGGVSEGVCAGLNVGLGSADDREAIRENRRRAVAAVAPRAALVTLHQVHSARPVYVTGPFSDEDRPRADAMVTDIPDLILGILTADCAPVLLADPEAGVVAAAHAGWKGAFNGVIEATVTEMERRGAAVGRMSAAVGPCIARRSYEVDDDFLRQFTWNDPSANHFFASGREGHHRFDLEGFAVSRLAACGISRIEALGEDTYSQPERFFSYRRATHRGEADYGRQVSLIALDPEP